MDGTEKNNQYINYANGDLMIYEKLIELLPPRGSARFLATHCIGASYDSSSLSDLDVYDSYCQTTGQFIFLDSELEELRQKIYKASDTLIRLYNDSMPQSDGRNKFPTEKLEDNDFMDKVYSAHKDFTDAYSALLNLARVKLNVLPALP